MAESAQPREFVPLLSGDRPLPHNTEAEVAVLGSVLRDPGTALDTASSSLNFNGSFYHPSHHTIFQSILELNREQPHGSVDIVTLSDTLQKKDKLEEVGGQAYLFRLINSVPSAANIEHYVEIVHQNALLRRLIRTSTEIAEKCYDPQQSVKELVDGIESEILSITNLKKTDDLVPVGDMMLEAIEYIDKLRNQDTSVMGLQTGYEGLDKIVMGLRPGEMFVLAARPSIGKTALALNMAENIALSSTPSAVGIFSLEMSCKQLVLRLLCSLARINMGDIRDCALPQGRWQEITRAGQRLKNAPKIGRAHV